MFGDIPYLHEFDELYGVENLVESIKVFVFDDKTAIPFIIL